MSFNQTQAVEAGINLFIDKVPKLDLPTWQRAFKAAAQPGRVSDTLSALARAWLIACGQPPLSQAQAKKYVRGLTVGIPETVHPDVRDVIGRHFKELRVFEGETAAGMYAAAVTQGIDVLFDPIVGKRGGGPLSTAGVAAARLAMKSLMIPTGPLLVQAHLDPKNIDDLQPVSLCQIINEGENERDVIREVSGHFNAGHQAQLYPLMRGGKEYFIVRKQKQGRMLCFPDWVGENLAAVANAHMTPAYIVIGPDGPVKNTNPCLVGSSSFLDQRCIIRAGQHKAAQRLGDLFTSMGVPYADPSNVQLANALSVTALYMGFEEGDRTLADAFLGGVELPPVQPRRQEPGAEKGTRPPKAKAAAKGKTRSSRGGRADDTQDENSGARDHTWDQMDAKFGYQPSHEM